MFPRKLLPRLLVAAGLLTGLSPVGPLKAEPLIQLNTEAQSDADSGFFKELRQIETILQAVSELRQLKVLRPVTISTIDRQQLALELEKQVAEEIPPEKILAEEALYKQLGMLPADFQYRQFLLNLYTEQISGFYDPKTQALKLIKDMRLNGMEQQLLIAHELVHALQDQHFELKTFMDPKSDNDDQTLAQMALIEGDATVASMEYLQQQAAKRPLMGMLDIVGSLFNALKLSQASAQLNAAPAFIQNSLLFPYDQGAQFVTAFRNKGWSWQKMQQFYQQPPLATEHILHPAKYLDKETPQKVELSLQPYFKGSQQLSASVWGELSYKQYFQQHLDWKPARDAASGWHGDRYQVLKTPQGLIFGFASVWDSPAEQSEFVNAWQSTLQKRYPGQKLERLAGGLAIQGAGQKAWYLTTPKGVLILEGLSPAHESALQQIANDWAAR